MSKRYIAFNELCWLLTTSLDKQLLTFVEHFRISRIKRANSFVRSFFHALPKRLFGFEHRTTFILARKLQTFLFCTLVMLVYSILFWWKNIPSQHLQPSVSSSFTRRPKVGKHVTVIVCMLERAMQLERERFRSFGSFFMLKHALRKLSATCNETFKFFQLLNNSMLLHICYHSECSAWLLTLWKIDVLCISIREMTSFRHCLTRWECSENNSNDTSCTVRAKSIDLSNTE